MSSKGSKTNTVTQKAAAPEKIVVVEKKEVVEKKDVVKAAAPVAEAKTDKKTKATPTPTVVAAPTPVTPVVVAAPTPAPVADKKTKGKAAAVVAAPTPAVVAAPTPATVVAAPTPAVVATPATVVVAPTEAKTDKKKAKATTTTAAPAVAVAVAATATPVVVEAKTDKKKAKVETVAVVQAGGAKVEKKEKKVVKKETEAVAQAGGDDAEEGEVEVAGSKLRYFKLFYNEKPQGRYSGRKPKQAANKAFSSIIKGLKESGEQNGGVDVDINFTIRECTRNSKHKDYKYIGKRQALETPVRVLIENKDKEGKKIGTKEIEYKFSNKLQKAPKA
jgi:hypothetical protein